ncbi:MAG TPA: plasmid mobilization relaxosome protein MobC [Trinickia sp.]|uniref:plasmid mobilization protein n=1 Tax=Trinickia sp. TaxID=2571163 RepID=UPI002B6FFBBA|nr:plasmid mobilization relaxosome protein MobC [Trinickia sp.]HVW49892.1 plasmid mobilization relaxosome protein MobC [Trinickia sp.]
MEKRNKNLLVRVNNDEYDRAKKMSEYYQMSMSEVVRISFCGSNTLDKNIRLEFLYQVNKIGVNLNQLTRKVNIKDKQTPFDILLLGEVQLIKNELKKLSKQYDEIIKIKKAK